MCNCEYSRKYRKKLKLEIITQYSHGELKCNYCDEKRIDGLSIDHILGGGRKHIKNLGTDFYLWLKKNNFPDGYQVLCMNCQHEKVMVNNEHNVKKPKTQTKQVWEDKLKWETLSFYSDSLIPYCKICNRTNLDILCLDHKNGDGYIDRKAGKNSGYTLYANLRSAGYPDKDKYQVLCHTCNKIKQIQNREWGNIE